MLIYVKLLNFSIGFLVKILSNLVFLVILQMSFGIHHLASGIIEFHDAFGVRFSDDRIII